MIGSTDPIMRWFFIYSYAYLQIPAGALVTNIADVNDEFYQVTYNGITGYVLKYLVYTGY